MSNKIGPLFLVQVWRCQHCYDGLNKDVQFFPVEMLAAWENGTVEVKGKEGSKSMHSSKVSHLNALFGYSD